MHYVLKDTRYTSALVFQDIPLITMHQLGKKRPVFLYIKFLKHILYSYATGFLRHTLYTYASGFQETPSIHTYQVVKTHSALLSIR